jgi:hypothetical protein
MVLACDRGGPVHQDFFFTGGGEMEGRRQQPDLGVGVVGGGGRDDALR